MGILKTFLNKFFALEVIGADKLLHFSIMFIISSVCDVFTTGFSLWHRTLIILLLSIIVGVLKEVYDIKVRNTVIDKVDIIYTVAGGIFFIFLILFKHGI